MLVDMDLEAKLGRGGRGELPCRVQRNVARVTWSKGPELKTAQILLVYQQDDNDWIKAGYGYIEELYDIEANFSLIINDVMFEHGDYYFCEILDIDTGRSFANKTRVEIFGKQSSYLLFLFLFVCVKRTHNRKQIRYFTHTLQVKYF